jgi:DNA-directed RNA polymerase specialized sigma24 family protein
MQDSAVVAAVVAGDADGFAAAYDQYAASLYGSCLGALPGPEAAEAVLDTFLIATAKLDGLRDPDRLGPWLHRWHGTSACAAWARAGRSPRRRILAMSRWRLRRPICAAGC